MKELFELKKSENFGISSNYTFDFNKAKEKKEEVVEVNNNEQQA